MDTKNRSHYQYLLVIFCVLILFILYFPLLLKGGIITDDWGDIYESINCSTFWQCYLDWFPLFSNRPLAPLPITLTTYLFGTHYSLYLVANSFIYISTLILTANSFAVFLSLYSRICFILLAAAPCIAMPLIVSPINQSTATVAFLYWAISFSLLMDFCKSRNFYKYFFSYALLLFGFLTYEIILPLLVFTAFIPALITMPNNFRDWFVYFKKYISPILLVLILVIFWQKILAPSFIEVYSRLNFNYAQLGTTFFTWIHLFAVQIPTLFSSAIAYVSLEFLIICIAEALLLAISITILNRPSKSPSLKHEFIFLIISTGALLASSLIFILTGESAVSWGYQARGLSSTWFTLAIFLASLVNYAQNSSKTLKLPIMAFSFIFSCFSILSFSIQRDKYIESWALQKIILKDVDKLMLENNVGNNPSIIFNVPRYAPKNYNRELVFSQSWDLPAAIAITTKHHLKSGIVIDSQNNYFNGLRIANNQIIVNDGGRVDLNNLWLYEFIPNHRNGSLTPLKNTSSLKDQMIKWGIDH